MKRLLLATAAVIALAVAAPLATAQYTTPPPATAPYTTPLPDDPMTPQDESLAAQPDTSATQSQSTVTTPGTPEPSDPLPSTTAQTQTDVDSTLQAQTQTGMDSTHEHTGVQTQTTVKPQTETDTASTLDAQTSTADASGAGMNVATPASFEQHARDAGMDGLPMTPQAVCMPREISLTTRGASLNRDKEHQLINAADRASACELQRVVINSPNGRADEARQLLIAHGVDAGMIEVVDSDTAGLDVEMNFSGIATSSEQYAQLFNTQQLASNEPTTAPGASYQPSPSAPPLEAPSSDTTTDEDGMSPTSGEPAVAPGMLDI